MIYFKNFLVVVFSAFVSIVSFASDKNSDFCRNEEFRKSIQDTYLVVATDNQITSTDILEGEYDEFLREEFSLRNLLGSLVDQFCLDATTSPLNAKLQQLFEPRSAVQTNPNSCNYVRLDGRDSSVQFFASLVDSLIVSGNKLQSIGRFDAKISLPLERENIGIMITELILGTGITSLADTYFGPEFTDETGSYLSDDESISRMSNRLSPYMIADILLDSSENNAIGYLTPIALVNRFDNSAFSSGICGDYRISYAMHIPRSNEHSSFNDLLGESYEFNLIFEGVLTIVNGDRLDCLIIHNEWVNAFDKSNSEKERFETIRRIYYEGVKLSETLSSNPVIFWRNFGSRLNFHPGAKFTHQGRIRASYNFGPPSDGWGFRQWRIGKVAQHREFGDYSEEPKELSYYFESVSNDNSPPHQLVNSPDSLPTQFLLGLSTLLIPSLFRPEILSNLTSGDATIELRHVASLLKPILDPSLASRQVFMGKNAVNFNKRVRSTVHKDYDLGILIDYTFSNFNSIHELGTLSRSDVAVRLDFVTCSGCHTLTKSLQLSGLNSSSQDSTQRLALQDYFKEPFGRVDTKFTHVNGNKQRSDYFRLIEIPNRKKKIYDLVCNSDMADVFEFEGQEVVNDGKLNELSFLPSPHLARKQNLKDYYESQLLNELSSFKRIENSVWSSAFGDEQKFAASAYLTESIDDGLYSVEANPKKLKNQASLKDPFIFFSGHN